jgi:hypothetical protein
VKMRGKGERERERKKEGGKRKRERERNREFHEFGNPQGSRVGYTGVRVRVANFVPSQNPYPQDEGTGFGGFFHGFLKPRLRLLFWIFPSLTVVL